MNYRYIVQRIPDTLTYRVLDTKTYETVTRLKTVDGQPGIYTVFDHRVDAQRVADNCNRADRNEFCMHTRMIERVGDANHAWECADCGYIYGRS